MPPINYSVYTGPGDTHEVYEEFGPRLKDLDIEVTMYDQLGSWYSETPNWDDPKIRAKFLKADYYVDEIEEVRQKLGYDNFYLAGHSWGGMIAMMYAHKYGQHLKGLIIISMIDNIPDYVTHIKPSANENFLQRSMLLWMISKSGGILPTPLIAPTLTIFIKNMSIAANLSA
ncbi:proline iminopeptidase [Agrilactobacillus composti DSM 18527 = JCM 14202]|nr:proline iminopeptidase [Agrilactobacillus composti DSM 18527 = JCM 14202]